MAAIGAFVVAPTISLAAWHVVILVDRSKSVGESNDALRRAESSIAEALVEGTGPLSDAGTEGGLRILGPADRVSLVHYGIDTQRDPNSAYKRLRGANLPQDYARVVWNRRPVTTAKALSTALRPGVRANLNVLAWAFPLSFAALRAEPLGGGPMETVVITLHDAELNAGGVALERQVFERYLSPEGRSQVRAAESALDRQVRLTDRAGSLRPFVEKVFREGRKTIVVAAYFARSQSGEAAAAKLAASPVIGESAEWTSAGRLAVPLRIPDALRGRPATFRMERSPRAVGLPLDGRMASAPLAEEFAGRSQRAFLTVWMEHADPVLGPTQVPVRYEAAVWVPRTDASAIAQRERTQWLIALAGLIGLAGYATAIAHGRTIRVRLWGYPGPRRLLRFGGFRGREVQVSEYRLRVPCAPGQAVALIELPGKLTRQLLMPGLRFRGDGPGLPEHFQPLSPAMQHIIIPYDAAADRRMTVEFSRTWLGRYEQRTRLELRLVFPLESLKSLPSPSGSARPTSSALSDPRPSTTPTS